MYCTSVSRNYQAGVSPRGQEIHDIILFWAAHLQVKTHQVRRMVSCLWIKVLFCNLSSLLEVYSSIDKVQRHFCHEYEILAYNKIIWLNILEWNKLTIGRWLVDWLVCVLFFCLFGVFKFFIFHVLKAQTADLYVNKLLKDECKLGKNILFLHGNRLLKDLLMPYRKFGKAFYLKAILSVWFFYL